MTITDWIQANSAWIVFGLIALVLVYYIIEAIEAFRKRTATFVLLFGFLFIIYLAFNIRNIEPADQVQVMLLLALLAVTGIYANANVKMAEEMREQRYDTVRPVIDILGTPNAGELMATQDQLMSSGLSCILHNSGLGPAIDVCSFVQPPIGNRQRFDKSFGTIAVEGKTEKIILALEQEGDRKAVVVYYKDVYSRNFESSRELIGGQGDWKLGPLKIIPVKEAKEND